MSLLCPCMSASLLIGADISGRNCQRCTKIGKESGCDRFAICPSALASREILCNERAILHVSGNIPKLVTGFKKMSRAFNMLNSPIAPF